MDKTIARTIAIIFLFTSSYIHASHSPEYASVIDLSKYEITDNENITQLITLLAKKNAPNLYLKLPGNINQVNLDFIDLSQFGIREFVLLEPDNPITIQQNENTADRNILIRVEDYRDVYIGGPKGNLTFKGLHKGIRGGHNARALGDLGEGLLSFSQKKYEDGKLYFNANVIDSRIYGLDHRGNTHGNKRSEQLNIKGKFVNAGLRLNSGFKNADLDVHVTDPYGVGFGWDGTRKSKNNGWSRVPPYWERSRGLSVTYADQLTGKSVHEFGKATWFISTVGNIGESEAEPFRFYYKDLGYSDTGIKIQTSGFLDTGGKIDHTGPSKGEKRRYMSFEELPHDYGYGLRNSVILEATSGDGHGGHAYFNESVSLNLTNISRRVSTALLDYRGDYSRGHYVTGNQVLRNGHMPLLEIHEADTVRDFQGYRIVIKSFPKLGRVGRDNLIENVVLSEGGSITVEDGATANVVSGAVFNGSPRVIIKIANKDYKGPKTSLVLSEISAPAGSSITADQPAKVSVLLDGKEISLPFVFGEEK